MGPRPVLDIKTDRLTDRQSQYDLDLDLDLVQNSEYWASY
jgi:hypothetical protein